MITIEAVKLRDDYLGNERLTACCQDVEAKNGWLSTLWAWVDDGTLDYFDVIEDGVTTRHGRARVAKCPTG